MRVGGRRTLSLLAITAIALHTMLWGAATPLAAGPTVDPFTFICHSETFGEAFGEAPAAAPAEQTPAGPVSAPTHACDHCNLCSAMAPPELDTVLAGHLTPAKLLQVLRPATAAAHAGIAHNPNRARGPPSFA